MTPGRLGHQVVPVVRAAEGVLAGTSSLTQALRDGGYTAAGARRMIHAMPASETVAAHLLVHPGAPLLRIRSTTWDKSKTPFDYYETWLRTDVVPLEEVLDYLGSVREGSSLVGAAGGGR